MKGRDIPMEEKNNNTVYQLQPKLLVTNFNFDAMAATVTQSGTSFKNTGVFRTKSDLVGMSWFTRDTLSHLDFRYPSKPDFSGVTLRYHYTVSGYTPAMDSESAAPTITVRTMDGAEYYIRLWNYIVDRPQDSWEKEAGNYLHKDVHFPEGRTPGDATGTEGNIVLDFDRLYAGWVPYIWQDPDGDGAGEWVENPDWIQVPTDNIKEIMWSFVPLGYNKETGYLEDSMPYEVEFCNWIVSGSCTLGPEAAAQAVTQVRLCDDYDDIYNMTPERVVSEYQKLGYRKLVNCYIGASHYYDKRYNSEKGKMNVKTEKPFNPAFEAWYADYLRRLHALGIKVIHSISMECVDPPDDWKQCNWAGVAGTTNWEPKPSLLSFVNYNVKMFYIEYVKGLARLSATAGMQPVIQLGESWWWYIEDGVNNSPCFYDSATRYEYRHKYGREMHVFKTGNDSIEGHEDVLYFLRDKNGEFTWLLKNELKAAYPEALFTVLFFPPSVMDKTRAPEMMSIVNLPAEYWSYPNLDFFMLEDYDYLIDDHMWKHRDALNFVQNNLAYPPSLIHYFAGFVLDSSKLGVWKNINQAIVDGFNQQFGEVYIWAYAQVKRDGWHPPVLISADPKPGNYAAPQNVVLSGPAGCQISYTTNRISSRTAVASQTVSIPVNQSTTLYVTAQNGGKQNEYELPYTIPMREVDYQQNHIDGDASEWKKDSILAVGSGRTHNLCARTDSYNLYVMAEGSQLNTDSQLCLYLDMAGNTASGFREMGWVNSGIDYMVKNGELFRYTGTGTDYSWEKTGTVSFARTAVCAEWAIPFSFINRTLPQPLYIGFGRDNGEYAPMLKNRLAEVSCLLAGVSPDTTEKYVVLPKVARVRKEPSTDSESILRLDSGNRVNVMYKEADRDGNLWAAVKLDLEEYKMGWIYDELILPDKPVVTETFPEHYSIKINGKTEEKYSAEHWGIYGVFDDDNEMTNGRYDIAIGPKFFIPEYPDDGRVDTEEFLAFNRYIDLTIRNRSTGQVEPEPIRCYARTIKAHTYNLYPDPRFMDGYNGTPTEQVEASVENGLVQTGIRYPYASNPAEWAPANVDASIIEFCNKSTGGINCNDFDLVRVTAYFCEEE